MASTYPLAPDTCRLQPLSVYPLTLDPRNLSVLKQMLNWDFGPNFPDRLLKFRMTKRKGKLYGILPKEERRIKICLGENHPPERDLLNERKKI